MPLLPTAQRDQIKVAVGVIALALAAAYYTYPYADRATELEQARDRLEQLEAQNDKARARASHDDLARLKEEAERAGAGLTAMRRLVPTEHEVPALLEEISTAARRVDLEISGVAPEPVLHGDEFDTYRYRITVAGGYHALTSFLANVGSLPRIVAPVSFTLAPVAAAKRGAYGPASLAAAVTLQTYVTHAPAGASNHAAASAGEIQP